MLVQILNGLIDGLVFILNSLSLLLPDSPFHFSTLSWGPFGSAIGAVLPVGQMILHMSVIIAAFLAYYAIRWALRLIRQVQ